MPTIRTLIGTRPWVAALLIAAALAVRVLVPGGYMPVVDHGRILVKVCTGMPDGPGTMTLAVPGLDHGPPAGDVAHGKCAYADLAQSVTGGVDPVLLAVMLAFAMSLALVRAVPVAPAAPGWLRPPLRGPPARA